LKDNWRVGCGQGERIGDYQLLILRWVEDWRVHGRLTVTDVNGWRRGMYHLF